MSLHKRNTWDVYRRELQWFLVNLMFGMLLDGECNDCREQKGGSYFNRGFNDS